MSDAGHEFGVGEYQMRNGQTATVCFVLPTPNDARCPLVGRYWTGKQWVLATWHRNGCFMAYGPSEEDLMPPRAEYWIHECQNKYACWKTRELAEQATKNASYLMRLVHVVELRPGERIVSGEVSDE